MLSTYMYINVHLCNNLRRKRREEVVVRQQLPQLGDAEQSLWYLRQSVPVSGSGLKLRIKLQGYLAHEKRPPPSGSTEP